MNNREFMLPGIACALLAILFPMYWITIFGLGVDGFEQALEQNLMQLSLSDLVFVIIGGLEIYVYLSLRKTMQSLLQSTVASVLLAVLAIAVLIFHATILFDIYIALNLPGLSENSINFAITVAMIMALGSLVIYSLVGAALGISILINSSAASLLRVFAILLLLSCVLQITVVFAFANLALFPIALLVLMAYFIKEPDMVEVV